jgi:hypothetical protein
VTAEPGSSSLYPPDTELLDRRDGLGAMAPRGTEPLATTTLAAWAREAGVEAVDVLKLDVQGAELDILRGAGALLDGVRALDLEVEFAPLYRGQPLFADVDAYLRERGFSLWRLRELTHHGLRGAGAAGGAREVQRFAGWELRHASGGGQLFWARAVYVAGAVADRAADDPWREHLADAVAAWALEIDDVAQAALGRAAQAGAPAEIPAAAERSARRAALRARARGLRSLDLAGAAARYARVAVLDAAGTDDRTIADRLGLTEANVRLLRRFAPASRLGLRR